MNVDVTVRILDPKREPVNGLPVDLESYHQARGWSRVGRGETDRDGAIRFREALQERGPLVPALRLVRAEREAPEVLAQIAAFQTARNVVAISFGAIVLLPDRGVPIPGSEDDPGLGRVPAEGRLIAIPQVLADRLAREPGRPEPSDPDAREDSGGRAVEALREMLAVETARVDQLEGRVARREERIAELEEERRGIAAELAEAKEALEVLRKSEESSPRVDSLAGAISGALNEARSLGGLELSNAEIRLRGIVSEAGSRFHPLDAAEARTIRPENVSELTLRLSTPRPEDAPSEVVPDVIGQTVGSARRRALAVGLGLDVIEEVTEGRPAGAIVSQAPEPGEPVGEARGKLSVVVAVPRSPDPESQ